MRAAARLAIAAASLAALPSAFAQDRGGSPQAGGTPGQFDFYVLALSWSPGFCETTGERRGSVQCETGRRLGFVTHGLWPQYEHGYPSSCGADRSLPARALAEAGDLYPDPGLARHEWRLHGTCSGLAPAEYLKAVARARAKVAIPNPLVELTSEGRTTPQNLERAFGQANPGLRPDMISVTCRQGSLQEVRICLEKDLSGFRRCPEIDRAACRFGPIRVPAPK